ncbi:hypothetical protein [Cohnella sp.]|uniref:hypothetical protein n=1 Tax=Cohnella sp. TaxID=1883426 RepID=UPI00356626D4
MKKIQAAFMFCFLLLAAACGNSSGDGRIPPAVQEKNSVSQVQVEITKEKYDNVSNGMTYEEVIGIVGGEGEVATETGEKGTATYGMSVMYQGKGGVGNASFIFIGDKLRSKSQHGLK